MDFLSALPRGLFVGIVLVGGLILIIAANPPHTVCDTQLESFKQSQRLLLFPQQVHGILEKPRLIVYEKACKEANSSGGCYEWIMGLHKVSDGILDIPLECKDKVMGESTIQGVVDRSIRLMLRLAWGEKPPETPFEKKGFLEHTDLSLFCQLVQIKTTYQDSQEWDNVRRSLVLSLPGADTMDFREAWRRSIFSIDCSSYR